ncbi:hypothetical protein SAMN02745119_01977 [Trichlorobacter thiogenes]|uniref:Uncharacterized protein n=1 Tax=Trichlorobacter thiogenes TaxID=115783 RepID=A0A1T4PIL5_9BACT|nr:hypothetical protein [Trichlorobacter thiogenes]SJZ91312.1 hypothetical protein SAMN02745119_01977 [Trichlorobacter thiogenes]
MAKNSLVHVSSVSEMESKTTQYISQGYIVANRNSDSVILTKKKQFSILMAIIGFFLAVFPLIIYIIIYMFQSDKMVEIRVSQTGA